MRSQVSSVFGAARRCATVRSAGTGFTSYVLNTTRRSSTIAPRVSYVCPPDRALDLDSHTHQMNQLTKGVLHVGLDLGWIPGYRIKFPNIWLRENCGCPHCLNQDTRQRLVNTFSIPFDIKPDNITINLDKVVIRWADRHESTYDKEWLKLHHFGSRGISIAERDAVSLAFRNSAEQVADHPTAMPVVNYEEVMSTGEGVRKWTENIYRYGFSFVRGCPVTPEATQTLLERIAFVRPTHYGGFWDFTADLYKKDMAYTTFGLGAHTDNTYFTDPARLQMLHLLSHTDGSGGESLLVDGFAAARELLSEDFGLYRKLQSISTYAHASGNENVVIQPSIPFPVFNHHPTTKELYQIRWNNEDRAPRSEFNTLTMKAWYVAARKWDSIIRRPSMERWFRLEPGTPLIFDNWRMLHGRAPFDGKRRMCGGYINNDDFMSRYLLLNYGREKVLQNL